MDEPQHARLHEFLEGEITATVAYARAMPQLPAGYRQLLHPIHRDHCWAVDALKEIVPEKPDDEARERLEDWSGLTRAGEIAAQMFGERTALAVLRVGEEFGITQYEDALRHMGLDRRTRDLIRLHLLPQARAHFDQLGELIGEIDRAEVTQRKSDALRVSHPTSRGSHHSTRP